MEGNEELFSAIFKALEGVTVLEHPRVPKKTIVSTLKDHTRLLKDMKQELSSISKTMKTVADEAAENRQIILLLKEDSMKHQRDLEILNRTTEEFKKQMSYFNEKIDDLPILKQQFKEQKASSEELVMKFNVHVVELTDFVVKTNKSISSIDKKCMDTLFQLKEIKEYVDHFEDSLILPASQVRVESTAGFGDRPLSLLEVLSQCNTSFEELTKASTECFEKIDVNSQELEKKAPESVMISVYNIEKRLGEIDALLEKEEDQGLGALRRQCEQLTLDVQNISADLLDKVDRDSVSLIVHEKYDEIVKYLQDALQSSAEDEQNFKAKADELQEMVMKLANSKCDRHEIAPLQEMLVKTEALLRKVSAIQKNDRPPKDIYSKKEIEAMLELKLDKEKFEQQMQLYLKAAKKNRKLSTMLGGSSLAGMAIDEGSELSENRDQAMWKGLADAMRDESDAAIMRASSNVSSHRNSMQLGLSEDSVSDLNGYLRNKQNGGATRNSVVFPNNSLPGVFKSASEGGKPGGITGHLTDTKDVGNMSTASFGIANPLLPGGAGSYINSPGNVSNQPMIMIPSANLDATQSSGYPLVPPSSQDSFSVQSNSNANPQDLSFLGAPIVGGGYNLRSAQLSKSALKPIGFADSSPDLEGGGYLFKGPNGQLYYTDEEPNEKTQPTAKKLVPQRRN